jgi:hypothetical protein
MGWIASLDCFADASRLAKIDGASGLGVNRLLQAAR